MSKLSFRARALDAAKPLPVYRHTDLPELRDCVSINRAVPQMPTGMETEEELEHHLQRALSVRFRHRKENVVIPVPEAQSSNSMYERLYRGNVKVPKQLIHIQPLTLESEDLDYDLDSEDEMLMKKLNRRMEVRPLQFENMMDRLEKASTHQLLSLSEAKLLLNEDENLLKSVYEYWLRKRRSCQSPSLIPHVKRERRDGSTNDDAYVAFRRRTEKMQTRKNRKSDEASYEKMLRLRREFTCTVSILEMIKRREKSKRELLHLTLELVERRYQMGDFSEDVLREIAMPRRQVQKAVIMPPSGTRDKHDIKVHKRAESVTEGWSSDLLRPKKKNSIRRVRSVPGHGRSPGPSTLYTARQADLGQYDFTSSGDEDSSSASPDEENSPEGVFVFRRKADCQYLCPRTIEFSGLQLLPQSPGLGLTPHRMGLSRRRLGRGGRVVLDRASSFLDSKHLDSRGGRDLVLPDQKPPLTAQPSLTEVLYNIQNLRRFSSRSQPCQYQKEDIASDHSRLTCRLTSMCPSGGVTEEGFQSHQQQLLQVLKQQLEQNKAPACRHAAHNTTQGAGLCESRSKTLDSAHAQFAASAVISAPPPDAEITVHRSRMKSVQASGLSRFPYSPLPCVGGSGPSGQRSSFLSHRQSLPSHGSPKASACLGPPRRSAPSAPRRLPSNWPPLLPAWFPKSPLPDVNEAEQRLTALSGTSLPMEVT